MVMHIIRSNLCIEIMLRMIICCVYLWVDTCEPFIRHIHENEIWKYQYPLVPSYVPPYCLRYIISLVPITCFIGDYLYGRKRDTIVAAFLGITLAYSVNGLITVSLKAMVGRPRPDFYYRCFPDGKGNDYVHCTGSKLSYLDGRKSFPSGHSSFAFTCMVFMTLYMIRKFDQSFIKWQSWQLCTCMVPIFVATSIAISRTCDYHHHYEDVMAGSILGSLVAYLSFRLYFGKVDGQMQNI